MFLSLWTRYITKFYDAVPSNLLGNSGKMEQELTDIKFYIGYALQYLTLSLKNILPPLKLRSLISYEDLSNVLQKKIFMEPFHTQKKLNQ